jgi:3-hydroxymyristoyl/3-hydroxydecanoyl-(acyl carrier protein) dehydratase
MNVRDSIETARVNGPAVVAGGATVFEFCFKSSDPVFAGHFPTRPILPGVFQLEMARMAVEWVFDCPLVVREISKSKFLRPILPEETIRLELKLSEKDGTIQARAAFSVGTEPAGETLLLLCRNH